MENQTNTMATKQGMPMKKRIVLIALMVCCAALIATGTMAYFTAEETAFNVISMGVLKMELHEETTGGEPWPDGGIEGVMPGMDIDKKVYIENVGGVDFWARISVEQVIEAAEGVEAELDFSNITLDLDEENWTEKDGWYYYNEAVKPGQETTPLFNVVQFGADLGNEYMNAHVEITVTAQTVQAKNNGATALEATGWTAEE